MYFVFFFQAEDGIRDTSVTGVQTCALPILVPGDVRGIARFLDEEARAPDEQVRPEHVLDRVQDRGVAHEIGQPREEQVRLVAQLAAEPPTVIGLDGLEPPAHCQRLAGGHHANREIEAVPAVLLDRGRSELGHGVRGLASMVPEDALAHTAYSGSPCPGDRSSSFTSTQSPAVSK